MNMSDDISRDMTNDVAKPESQGQSPLLAGATVADALSPYREMIAYEALWSHKEASFKTIADIFRKAPHSVPSELVSAEEIARYATIIEDIRARFHVERFGVRVRGLDEYPRTLQDARNPVQVLYYQGYWELVNTPAVAVVGSRKPSPQGIDRARRLARCLVKDGFTVVSGLAEGIDTAAHTQAIQDGGNTIAVIGTPLSHVYPKSNAALQEQIREKYLLISQVPFKRYIDQDYRINRGFFPERNITMSALTQATVIVEASDTSGTLIQARAALAQGRKLFILESCFQNKAITWPERYAQQGAIRVSDYDDIREHLKHA